MGSAPAGIADADWLTTPAIARAFILVQQQEIQAWLSSRPGQLPPEVLTNPYMTLSRHTAPIIHSPPRLPATSQMRRSCNRHRRRRV